MTIARKPDLSRLLEKVVGSTLAGVHVCMPAQVITYNPSDSNLNGLQTVDVRPVSDRTLMEEDRETSDSFPVIYSVPLVFPGSGSYRLTFPIAAGDYVLLVFADRSTDEFIANGGVNVPQDLRTHSIADAFAIPGVTPAPNALQNVQTGTMVLGKNGNTPQKAARQNDGVGNGTLHLSATTGTNGNISAVLLTYVAGDGSGQQTTSASAGTPAGTGTITLKEKITGGSNDVGIT